MFSYRKHISKYLLGGGIFVKKQIVLLSLMMILVLNACGKEEKNISNSMIERDSANLEMNDNYTSYSIAETGSDEVAVSDDEGVDNSIPYVDIECKYINDSYSLLKQKGDIPGHDIVVTSGLPLSIYNTDEDGVDYYYVESNTYMGVKDDTVVAFTYYVGAPAMQVRDLLTVDEFFTQPLLVIERDSYVDLYWKLKNGYMIISAIPWGAEYYNYAATVVTFVNNLEYYPIESKKSTSDYSSQTDSDVPLNWDYSDFAPAPFTVEEFWDLQVVNEEWYDNGVFSMYMSMAFPDDNWNYSASIAPDMINNPYGYLGFDIYTHQCDEKQQVYRYLVPITPATAPEVYVYDDTSNCMKLVFCNGELLE